MVVASFHELNQHGSCGCMAHTLRDYWEKSQKWAHRFPASNSERIIGSMHSKTSRSTNGTCFYWCQVRWISAFHGFSRTRSLRLLWKQHKKMSELWNLTSVCTSVVSRHSTLQLARPWHSLLRTHTRTITVNIKIYFCITNIHVIII